MKLSNKNIFSGSTQSWHVESSKIRICIANKIASSSLHRPSTYKQYASELGFKITFRFILKQQKI